MWWKPWSWFPVGVRVHREGAFTREGVTLLLAHRLNVAEPRNQYGTRLSEATDPANQFAWTAPPAPTTDWESKADADGRDRFYEAHKDSSRNGHLWRSQRL